MMLGNAQHPQGETMLFRLQCAPVVGKKTGGFTLVELLIVLVVVAVLASIAYPSYRGYVQRAQRTDGIALLAETTGIFTETAGGVTTAVLKRLADRGEIGPDERVVVYITGDGLKTLDAVAERVEPVVISPTVSAFETAVDGRGAALPA
jgi:prepilin-type N-terminal cleavage/methylation domain-containing protein